MSLREAVYALWGAFALYWLLALATNLYWLIAFATAAAYVAYSAKVEERQMCASFPAAYAHYKAKTRMLIPFVP